MNHTPLLLQLVVILGTARILGLILRYLGQPAVIGEMAAGIALGPIVFGAFAPELHLHVFEPASLGALNGLSKLGLVLFMFIIGAELRLPMGVKQQLVDNRVFTMLMVMAIVTTVMTGPLLTLFKSDRQEQAAGRTA